MKTQTTLEQIELAGETVVYRQIRSDRRSLSMEIGPQGLLVRAPYAASAAYISRFLRSRAHWILARLHAMEEKQEKALSRLPDLTDAQKQALEARYREAARACITARVNYYTNLLGASYERISIRDQKTRWGICSSKGGLNFSWRLILAPPAVMEYVIVHEVCHLLHMDHSHAFWEEVGALMPDYAVHRKWLRQNGSLLAQSYTPLS